MVTDSLKEQLSRKGCKCKLQFTATERDYFEHECGFTDEELTIFRLRTRGFSIIRISFEMEKIYAKELPTGRYSVGKVEARIRSIKNKIMQVL